MAQIALPFRIVLVAVLVLGALWFTVLRPKDAATEPAAPAAPGVTGLSNAVDKAHGAAAASDAANAKLDAATGGQDAAAGASSAPSATSSGTTSANGTAKAKASKVDGVAAGDPSASLVRALGDGKVVVLLFAGNRAVDDRAARRAVHAVGRRGGAVVVRLAGPREVGKYEAITQGVKVNQFPTVLVIGPDRVAKPITGFTTGGEVDQFVADAVAEGASLRRLTAGRDAAASHARRACGSGADAAACREYFAAANDVCVAAVANAVQAGATAGASGATPAATITRLQGVVTQTVAQFAALQPPAAQKAGHDRAVALMRADAARVQAIARRTTSASNPLAAFGRALRRADSSRAGKRAEATMRSLGYAACA
jgi:hypothetical protein